VKERKVFATLRDEPGSAAVTVEDDGDQAYIRDLFAHWPVKHLRVLAAGIEELLRMSPGDRKACANRVAERQELEGKHPGRLSPRLPWRKRARRTAA
jgi:hypothetical protein